MCLNILLLKLMRTFLRKVILVLLYRVKSLQYCREAKKFFGLTIFNDVIGPCIIISSHFLCVACISFSLMNRGA